MEIRFGSRVWTLSQPAAASISRKVPAISDIREAIDQVLSAPIDFSSLDQAIVPGDQVAIAVDPAIPSLPVVVSGVAQWLIEHGVTPSNLSIVLAAEGGQVEQIRGRLDQAGLGSVGIERHDPDDSRCLSYIAANESAQAIYLNRTLVDADVVLPISCARSNYVIDYLGSFGIFPLFSSRDTMGRMRNYSRLINEADRKSIQSEVRQAAWWLGLIVAIQVVPASNDQVANLCCGTLEPLEEESQRLIAGGRDCRLNSNADVDLVIAVLDGADQSWTPIARGLHYALGYCANGGSIALCSNLNQPIGSGLRRLRDSSRDLDQIAKRLSRESSEDALAASVILEATREHHLYLASEHNPRAVEGLGLSALTEASELTNLLNQHARSLVIYSAQHP